ncbi:MAG TPA: hypothetical protein VK735_18530 [Pseudonocardia sp.]|uniref:hypothetical protein n=1 Tax=Pseudonocardia sp. TaxID=60912 RepID=UPI002CAE4205|nr:hypothetical protein [Pseudonocardia sp.]HTF49443.1 hypothetical protein [Pseudonocardia sp.]
MGQNVAALIERLNPNTSVRQLEREAGLKPGQIARFRKASEQLERVPPASTILALARACRCDPNTMFRAFCLDTGMPVDPPPLTDDEAELLTLFRRLSRTAQRMFLGAVRGLVHASEAEKDTPA